MLHKPLEVVPKGLLRREPDLAHGLLGTAELRLLSLLLLRLRLLSRRRCARLRLLLRLLLLLSLMLGSERRELTGLLRLLLLLLLGLGLSLRGLNDLSLS